MRHLFLIGLLSLASALRAADSTMELPPLLVEETHQTRPWSFAAVPGFEFLSLCPDDQSRRFILGVYRAQEVLGILIPPDMRAHYSVPTAFILYPEDLEKGLAQAMVDQMKQTAELSNRFTDNPVRVLPGLRLDDPDSTIIFTLLKSDFQSDFLYSSFARDRFHDEASDAGDSARLLGIEPSYAQVLLMGRTPAPPAWFAVGFNALYSSCNLGANSIEMTPMVWNLEGVGDSLRGNPQAARTLLPLEKLFEEPAPSHTSDDPEVARHRALWEQESALFMRWAYDGEDPKRIAAFRAFVNEACAHAVDERMFADCFGFGYSRMRDILSDYLADAVVTGYTLHCEVRDPPAFNVSTASKDQVARIRGDWERRARRYMLSRSEVVSRSIADQARHTFEGARRNNSRDPAVWAVEGLFDYDMGEFDAARPLLQKAADAGVIRPMVYLDLTSLAVDSVFGGTAPPTTRFTTAQARAIFIPVNQGLAQEPKLAGFYAAISDVLAHSDHTLDQTYLPILDQGARLYPSIPVIVYRTAILEGMQGNRAEMLWLLHEGLKRPYPASDHRIFEGLKATVAGLPKP